MTQGAGAGGGPKDLEDEFIVPEDLDDVKLVPGIDVDNILGDNGEVLDWEFLGNEFDVYTPLTWEEMINSDKEKAEKIKEAKKRYEEWLKTCKEAVEFEEVDLINESDDSK